MKINSNALGIKIHLVCRDCGHAAMKLPENKGKRPAMVSTFHGGTCDVCKKRTAVTESRDYGYPVFEVEKVPIL